MADPEIKIKRYADKENLKELIKYSKDTFATHSEVGDATIKINYGSTNLGSFTTNQSANATVDISPIDNLISENFYTKEQIDTKLESGSGGTGGGSERVLDMWPDGAEAHNAMWGGRDITAAFNNGTVSEHIADGTFKDIFPGDYITKKVTISGKTYNVTWVVADCDYWINKNGMETHHVAIVPQQPIFNAQMNYSMSTEGGYAGSYMYDNVIPDCATGIVKAFESDHILTFGDRITDSVDDSHVSSGLPQEMGTPGFWGGFVSVQCNLMSEKMVYGAPICSGGATDNIMATRQMSAFRLSERLINYNRQAWWLRDVVSSAGFAFVDGQGNASAVNGVNEYGVRPFALLC